MFNYIHHLSTGTHYGKYAIHTCSTIDANRPRAIPCSSSLVMTALPNFITSRLAYFSCDLSANDDPFTDCESADCSARFRSNCIL